MGCSSSKATNKKEPPVAVEGVGVESSKVARKGIISPAIKELIIASLKKNHQFSQVIRDKSLQDDALDKLVETMTAIDFDSSVRVCSIGDKSTCLYFIARGSVVALNNNNVELTRVGKGEIFGEIGFLFNTERSAHIRTERPSTFYVLQSKEFKEITEKVEPFKGYDLSKIPILESLSPEQFLTLKPEIRIDFFTKGMV